MWRPPAKFLEIALVAAIAGVLIAADPFGLKDAADRYTFGVFNRLLWPIYDNRHQEAATVVLIRDRTLEEFGEHWPVSYSLHAQALETILSHRPKAVFVDILFTDRREDPGTENFRETIADYRSAGIPIFLADLPSVPRARVRPDFAKDAAGLVNIGIEGSRADYLRYELRADSDVPSPAWALFSALCADAERPAVCASGTPNPADFAAPLDVIWSGAPPRLDAYVTCNTALTTRGAVNWAGLHPNAGRQTCSYAPVLPVENLVAPGPEYRPAVRSMVEGKIIFYAVQVAAATDIVDPPTHTPQAGVHLHAMALDNLLTFGSGYKRSEIDLPGGIPVGKLVEFLLTLLALAVVAAAEWKVARMTRLDAKLTVLAVAGLTVLASSVVIGLALFQLLNLSPMVLGGLIGLALTMKEMVALAWGTVKDGAWSRWSYE